MLRASHSVDLAPFFSAGSCVLPFVAESALQWHDVIIGKWEESNDILRLRSGRIRVNSLRFCFRTQIIVSAPYKLMNPLPIRLNQIKLVYCPVVSECFNHFVHLMGGDTDKKNIGTITGRTEHSDLLDYHGQAGFICEVKLWSPIWSSLVKYKQWNQFVNAVPTAAALWDER